MTDDFQKRLDQLKATGKARRNPDCPPEPTWRDLAAGLLPESEAAKLMEHSTGCDACGLLLRQAIEDFAADFTAEENEQLSSLKTAQPGWQKAFARKLATKHPKPVRDRSFFPDWRPRPAFQFAWAYAAAAVVLLVAGAWVVQMWRAPSIDQLIAAAYTEQRPFELRLTGAAHGQVRQVRSGARSPLDKPAALLTAESLIREQLATRPNDAQLLIAKGRIELLEGDAEAAIKTFGRLLDAYPDSPELLTDLATAHFQRAQAGDRAIDYGQAIELLSRALTKNPDDPVALFNRAIALEKMFAYNEAIRDWEHYLRVDPKGEWNAEAQKRLGDLREQIKTREKPAALLLTDPAAAAPLLRARATGQSTTPVPWAASLDEEYLDLAVREWLPALYVSVDSHGQRSWRRNPAVWDALTATADVLRTHHKDPWLADFLHDLPPDSALSAAIGHFVAALDSLGRAAKANAAGDPDAARPLAESAARSFGALRSTAGLLRAREETIYSLVRSTRPQECIQTAGQQLQETTRDSYSWLKGQVTLWHATCQAYAGNLDLAQRLSEQALELTKSTGYAGQNLRSVHFASGFLRSTERNWQDTRVVLQMFWAAWHNPFRAYEFYAELAILAQDAERWHLRRLLRREALRMIARTPDLTFQAVAHYRLAVAAKMAGDMTEAESEFTTTLLQFATLPDSPTRRGLKAASEIDLALVEIQQGRPDSAAARLQQVRPLVTENVHSWTAYNYHQALGRMHASRKNLVEAEKALWSAVQVGEVRVSSLESDTDRLAWERDAAPAYRTLVDLYAQKSDTTTRALEVWEWYRALVLRGSTPSTLARGQNSRNLNAGPESLSRVSETLRLLKRETVISFARLPSGVAAWAFDDRGINFAWVAGSPEDLTHRVKHFAFLCADPSSNLANLRQEGRSLYDLLLAPFERHLEPGRRLIVEPDAVLSEVPWPALVDSRGEYLGAKFAIVVSPGLGYWLNLRPPAAISPEQKALVVGMPALSPAVALRFSPLPEADREARSIAARFRHSRLLSGMEVTSLAIRQELPRSDVFHFAGHAVSRAMESGLVLASLDNPQGNADEPTLLSAGDLERSLFQRLQLVVLSACATAETEKGFAEPDTLVRGFLRAGVPQVVASRWPVDSQTTDQMMAEFYTRLFAGLTTANALQQATNTLRTKPATSHPYYWAAFGSYGR